MKRVATKNWDRRAAHRPRGRRRRRICCRTVTFFSAVSSRGYQQL